MKKRERKKRRRSKIFDDVFRTICQKMPVLLIAVINEAFGTDYPDEEGIIQLRNEYLEQSGKIVTDAVVQIDTSLYHVECQSVEDGSMVVRMIQYDFAIALEEALGEGKPYRMKFPGSCVIYLRGSGGDHNLRMEVELPDGTTFNYTTRAVNVQSYSNDEIFRKRLLMFLPYHILRYEGSMPTAKKSDREKLDALLGEYSEICRRLEETLDEMGRSDLYTDLIKLIERINEHVIKSKQVKEEVGGVMGGRILELQSEKDRRIGRKEGLREGIFEGRREGRKEGRREGRREGRKEGRREGKYQTIYELVQEGTISLEKGAEKLEISVEQLKANMLNTGYTLPEV